MSTTVPETLTDDVIRELSDRLNEPDWLLETRLEALSAVDELDFPDVIRTPGRLWTNLDQLDFNELIDPLTQTEEKDQIGVEGVEVYSLSEAIQDREELLREYFGSVVPVDKNRLVALSTALFSTGTVVYVPKGVTAEDVTIRTSMNSQSLFNYTLIVTEESSSVTILERQNTMTPMDENRYYSGIVEIDAGRNSTVQYGSLQDLSENTYAYMCRRSVTARDATTNLIECNLGSRLTKTETATELNGDGSGTQIVGAFFGHHNQHFDIDSRVWHNGEHTTADLVTRGVIDDQARSVYEGTQIVGRDAWDTSSFQRENTLMLSEESEADASPKLIINNHDTEASHSASVGQIDREDLLYMMTRGLPHRKARNMLVEGFFVPILEVIKVDELREDLEARISHRLRDDEARSTMNGRSDAEEITET